MNGDQQPAVTIEHELPGRLRIRLSHALRQPERVRRLVAEHAGVGEVQYTAVSRSMLVRYDPKHISTEEIVIRIATGLSLEQDNAGIRVLTRPPTRELTDSAFYSGIALLAALALRVIGPIHGRQCGPGADCRARPRRGPLCIMAGWTIACAGISIRKCSP